MPSVETLKLSLLNDQGRRRRVLEIRSEAEPVLANNLLPHFTDHSIAHSDRMTALVDGLAIPLGARSLSDREAEILYLACYLHDIGQQVEQIASTRTITDLGLSEAWAGLNEVRRRDVLRIHHAGLSAEIVQRSIENGMGIGLRLRQSDDPSLVAQLCAAHTVWLPKDAERYERLMDGPSDVRMRLLSGLLRVADILEESSRRAQRDRANTLLLDDESQVHWWRHYYTKEVHLDPVTQQIELVFEYPESKRKAYEAVVPELQVPDLQAEIERHRGCFAANGLGWHVKTRQLSSEFSTVGDMPSNIFALMVRQVQDRREADAKAARDKVLERLDSVEEDVKVVLAHLEPQATGLPKAEAARRYEESAALARTAGASSTEAAMLAAAQGIYREEGDHKGFLRTTLKAAPLELDLYGTQMVSSLVADIDQALIYSAQEGEATDKEIADLLRVKARASMLSGQTEQATSDSRHAIALYERAGDHALSAKIQADLSLGLYLWGEATEELSADESEPPHFASETHSDAANVAFRVATMARILAERADAAKALLTIDQALTDCPEDHPLSRVVLLNAKAEILFLSNRDEEAVDVLEETLGARLTRDVSTQNALRRNLVDCRRLGQTSIAFWENNLLRDRERKAGDPDQVAIKLGRAARQDRDHGRFEHLADALFEAGEGLEWSQLRRVRAALAELLSESHGGVSMWAASHLLVRSLGHGSVASFVEACLQYGQVQPALHASMAARQSHLPKHVAVAAKVLAGLADALPDAETEAVFDFLLPHVSFREERETSCDDVRPVWDALGALAPRLGDSQWERFLACLDPESIGDAPCLMLASIASALSWCTKAEVSLRHRAVDVLEALVKDYPRRFDQQMYYPQALNSLMVIAESGDRDLLGKVRDVMFPPGDRPYDVFRLQHADKFPDVRFGGANEESFIEDVAEFIRKQVQRVPIGAPEPTPPPGYSVASQRKDAEGVTYTWVVNAQTFLSVFDIGPITSASAERLRQSATAMLREPANSFHNRHNLTVLLTRLSDSMNVEQRNLTFDTLEDLALSREPDAPGQSFANLNESSSLFGMGRSEQLRSSVLVLLSKLAKSDDRLAKIFPAIDAALLSSNTDIRAGGLGALAFLPALTDTQFASLSLNLGDSNVDCAQTAVRTLYQRADRLDASRSGLLLIALRRLATMSGRWQRQNAARLARRVRPNIADDGASVEYDRLLSLLGCDLLASVRRLANGA